MFYGKTKPRQGKERCHGGHAKEGAATRGVRVSSAAGEERRGQAVQEERRGGMDVRAALASGGVGQRASAAARRWTRARRA